MKKAAIFAAIVIAATMPCISAAQQTHTVVVPGGLQIPVHVVGSLSSGSAKVGQTFEMQAAHDVAVNDMVVVKSGAEGQGTVKEVDGAGGNGHSGSLALSFDWIYSADGGKIRLSNSDQKQSEEDRKGASSTATIIGFATLGLGGLFGHNLARGREVVVDSSKTLSAFVADTVHVTATEHTNAEHFDH